MTIVLTKEAADLIYRTVSVLHSLASTLTGEAKGELTTLQALLAQTNALPRDQADALASRLMQVREHLTMGDSPDRIGDGKQVWDVFLAAWALRVPMPEAHSSAKQNVLESLAYIIESIAQLAHSSTKEELESLVRKLKSDATYQFPGSDKVLAQIESANADYMIFDRRRDALDTLCKASRELWRSLDS